MTQQEVLSANQAKLNAWADFLGLKQQGKRQTWWVRKQARHPITKRDFVIKESMRTPDLRTAIVRAQPVVEKFLAGVQTTLEPMVSAGGRSMATLGEVLANYEAWEHGVRQTRRRNARALRRVLGEMYPEYDDIGRASVELVDGKIARRWLMQEEERAAREFLPGDREAFERRKRSRNQALANAQSVFSRRAVQRYRDMGLRVPDAVRSFAEVLGLEARPAPPPEDFSAEELAKIREGLPALRERSPGAYTALMLTMHAALRNAENMAARWSWIGALGEQVFIDLSTRGAFEPKGRDGWVQIDPALLALLPCRAYPPAPDDHLVMGENQNQRERACYREVNAFLQSCGIQRCNGKLAYRARGHAITQIYLDHGPAAAKEFARHSTQRTTDRYYMGVKMPYAPRSVAAMAG